MAMENSMEYKMGMSELTDFLCRIINQGYYYEVAYDSGSMKIELHFANMIWRDDDGWYLVHNDGKQEALVHFVSDSSIEKDIRGVYLTRVAALNDLVETAKETIERFEKELEEYNEKEHEDDE